MKKGSKKCGSGHVSGMSPKTKDPKCASSGVVFGHSKYGKGSVKYES